MIDLHSHILPGLDDGSRTVQDARALARRAAEDGVTAIAATPHVRSDYPTRPEEMERGVLQASARTSSSRASTVTLMPNVSAYMGSGAPNGVALVHESDVPPALSLPSVVAAQPERSERSVWTLWPSSHPVDGRSLEAMRALKPIVGGGIAAVIVVVSAPVAAVDNVTLPFTVSPGSFVEVNVTSCPVPDTATAVTQLAPEGGAVQVEVSGDASERRRRAAGVAAD